MDKACPLNKIKPLWDRLAHSHNQNPGKCSFIAITIFVLCTLAALSSLPSSMGIVYYLSGKWAFMQGLFKLITLKWSICITCVGGLGGFGGMIMVPIIIYEIHRWRIDEVKLATVSTYVDNSEDTDQNNPNAEVDDLESEEEVEAAIVAPPPSEEEIENCPSKNLEEIEQIKKRLIALKVKNKLKFTYVKSEDTYLVLYPIRSSIEIREVSTFNEAKKIGFSLCWSYFFKHANELDKTIN